MNVIALWEERLIQGFYEELYIWVGISCSIGTFYGMVCKYNNANANLLTTEVLNGGISAVMCRGKVR